MKTKQKVSHKWFWIGLFAMVLAAPNSMVIKYLGVDLDIFVFNASRFAILSLICLPFVLMHLKKMNSRNIKYSLLAGFYLSIAVVSFVAALQKGPASYVSMLALLSPILFVIYSIKLTGDKIKPKALAGITLSALGAFVIVFLPIAIGQGAELQFYPAATLLMLINVFTFPLVIIYSKKANEAGLNLISVMGLSSTIVFVICSVLALFFATWDSSDFTFKSVFTILYSGVVVALFSRLLNIASYEHVGAAVTSALGYFEILLAISLPIIIFDEQLSFATIIGGVLILGGVYLVEYKKSNHIKHYFLHRHH